MRSTSTAGADGAVGRSGPVEAVGRGARRGLCGGGLAGLLHRRAHGGPDGVVDGLLGLGREPALQDDQVLALVHHSPAVADHPERHAQVRRQAVVVERVLGHVDVAQLAHRPAEHLAERRGGVAGADRVLPVGGVLGHPGVDAAGDVGCGDQLHAHRLGQRADGGGDQLLAQAGHHPAEAVGRQAREGRERDMYSHAVRFCTRLELVGEREAQVALRPARRERRLVDRARLAHQQLARERQQVGVVAARGLPPLVEVPAGHDVVRDPLVVEREQRVVVDHEVPSAGPCLQALRLGQQAPVLVEERVVGGPLALDQRVPDEQLAGVLGVDLGVQHPALVDDRDAVEQDLLERRRGTLLGGPGGLRVGAFHQVSAHFLRPLGLDAGHVATPQAGRLDELRGHDPGGGLPRQARPREDREPRAASAEVLVAARADPVLPGVFPRDGAATSVASCMPICESRPARIATWMRSPSHSSWSPSVSVSGAGRVHDDAERLGQLAQLRDDVLPLADAQVVEVLRPAHPPERGPRQVPLLVAQVVPQVQVGEQVRGRDRRTGSATGRPSRAPRPAARAGPGWTARRR